MITLKITLPPVLLFFVPLATLAAPNSPVRVPLPPRYAIADLGAGNVSAVLDDGEVLGTDDSGQEWVLRGGERVAITPEAAARLTDQDLVPGKAERSGHEVACVRVNGAVQFLIVPAGVSKSSVAGVNKAGLAVGFCVSRYGRHPVLWNLHTPDALPRILQPPGTSTGDATSINDAGQVVGAVKVTNSPHGFGFVWHIGLFTNLGCLNPGRMSQVYPVRINRRGQVVGNETDVFPRSSGQVDARQYPVFWEQGHLYELGRRLVDGSDWILEYAVGFNDKGQIVGIGLHHHQRCIFLLTPSVGTQRRLTMSG